jgi:hypothetical protein
MLLFNNRTIKQLIPFDNNAEEDSDKKKKKDFKRKNGKRFGKSMNGVKNPNIIIEDRKDNTVDDSSFVDPANLKNVFDTLTQQMMKDNEGMKDFPPKETAEGEVKVENSINPNGGATQANSGQKKAENSKNKNKKDKKYNRRDSDTIDICK